MVVESINSALKFDGARALVEHLEFLAHFLDKMLY
jgi:hypothetical protein